MPSKKNGEPSWKWRRVIIFAVSAWSFYQLTELVNAPDTRVNDTIAFGYLTLIAVLVLGYVGFATAQDVAAIFATKTGLPYAEPPVAVDGEPYPQGQDADPEPPAGYAR